MKRLYVTLIIRAAGLVVLAGLLAVALAPHRAAACGTFDVSCPVDVGIYAIIVAISEWLWAWNRAMLYVARLIEGLRVWLIGDVLGTALDATVAGMKFPFWIAVGIAWIVFTVSFLIQAVVRLDWVDLRKGMRNAILAVILFQLGSQAMSGMEQIRVTVGQGFQSIAATSITDATTRLGFYVGSATSRADSVETPHSIYDGADGCPGVDLKRVNPQSMFMSDYLANFLFADAHDIHCPSGAGVALPDTFVKTFEIRDISNDDADGRARLTIQARMGLARQAQAILPTVGAVLEQVMHLVFALALASLWFGLVISTMFSLFLPTEGMYKAQIDGMLATLKASWLATFWVGIGMSLVGMAASTGNALAVNGVSIGMLVVFIFQIRGAVATLGAAMTSTSSTLGHAPAALGGLARGFGRLATDRAIIGAAWATGNGGELVEAGVQQLRRRLAFSTSGNLIAQAGERLLLNKAMGPVEDWVRDEKDARAIGQREDEATWYEQRLRNPRLTDDERGRALRRTEEIDTEIESRQAASTKRQVQQARSRGSWDKADRLQREADEQEIDRLERKIDEAHKSGDPKQMAAIPQLQRRIDFLRGVPSAAVDAANGGVGAAVVSGQRAEPVSIGLQEIAIARAANGQLSANGHAITAAQLSADGHRVALSAGNRAVDISRDDAAAANSLEVGKVLTVPANVRDPSGSSIPAPHAGGAFAPRADLEQRIQEQQRQERGLLDQRETAFQEHRFGEARKLSERINALRVQIATDRKALGTWDRAGAVGVRVPPPVAGAVSLSPSAASADDLAFVPPPGGEVPSYQTPQGRYQADVDARRAYVEQSVGRLEALQRQQAQLAAANRNDEAAALDKQIAERQEYVRRNQEIYNQIAAAPPAGVAPAPQIVVGAYGFVPAGAGSPPVMLQAPPAAPVAQQATAQHAAPAPSVVVQPPPTSPPTTPAPSVVVQPPANPPAVSAPAPSVVVQAPAGPPAAAAPSVVVQAPVNPPAVSAPAPSVVVQVPATPPAVSAPTPPAPTPAQRLDPSMVPPHARPAERPAAPPATPVQRLDPSMAPPGVGGSGQPAPATGSRSTRPRPGIIRGARRNGSRGGSGGTT